MFREHGSFTFVEGLLGEHIYSLNGAVVIPFNTMNVDHNDGASMLRRRYVEPMTRTTNST